MSDNLSLGVEDAVASCVELIRLYACMQGLEVPSGAYKAFEPRTVDPIVGQTHP